MSGVLIAGHAAKHCNIGASPRFLTFFVKWTTTYKTRNIETPLSNLASEFVENAMEDGLIALDVGCISSQSTFASVFRTLFNGKLAIGNLHDDEDVAVDELLKKVFYIDGEESE